MHSYHTSCTINTLRLKHLAMCVMLLVTLGLLATVAHCAQDWQGAIAPPFWNSFLLDSSVVTDDPRQYVPLLKKLDSGKPINVMAWGSSVVANHAGCGLNKAGRDFIEQTRGWPPTCERKGSSWMGWGTRFMYILNQIWPHKDHTFANNGYGGAFLTSYVISGCPEPTIPDPIDVIILENLGGDSQIRHVEQLLNTLFRFVETRAKKDKAQTTRPAILLLNSMHVVRSTQREWKTCIVNGTCEEQCTPDRAGFQHLVGVKEFGQDKLSEQTTLAALGQYYGIAVLSVGRLLHAAMRDGVVPSEGVEACKLFSSFMVDHIHPNNLGKKLFADILSHPILRARGDLRELEARPAIQLPSRAMTPGGGLLYNKQCYMVLDPRMQHMMDVRKISKAFLPIVKSTGWSLVFHDKGNNTSADVPPLKPGLVAHEGGSVLQVKINTQLASKPGIETRVYLSYLATYEKRGALEVSCLSGCKCSRQYIQSHMDDRVSVTRVHEFEVSESRACVLQLKSVKERTGSTFKVTGLVVRSPVLLDPSTAGRRLTASYQLQRR